MEEEKRTYEAETAAALSLRLRPARDKNDEPDQKPQRGKEWVDDFLSEELIAGLIERIRSL
ncbi:MAG: hypothetical protein U9Q82_11650 [Chloroflexota bacterium]|nr:hypothetical protein [Chloroflexota bacterium]